MDPADRGKETTVALDWTDDLLFRDMIRRRIIASTELEGSFQELWSVFFETHVLGQESFAYISDRTQLRPREVLRFCRECVDVAVSRGHDRVTEGDVLYAEKSFSANALHDLAFDIKDVKAELTDVPYSFIGSESVLSPSDVESRLSNAGVPAKDITQALDLLLWFGFLGIHVSATDEERYSYQYQHDLRKMRLGLLGAYAYCIHPAFRRELGCAAP
jgi:hypothetical protein